jgi:alpha-tubulin suppressor-like RCC1 family protein
VVTDASELWAWGWDDEYFPPLGHGERANCLLPKPIEALRGVKVDAVAAGECHELVLADDGRVYAWGHEEAKKSGALGLGISVQDAGNHVLTSQRIPGLRVACGL